MPEPWAPGPWQLKESLGDWYVLDAEEQIVAAVTHAYPEGAIYLEEPDARLIALAPEMAAMLAFIVDNGYEPPDTSAEITALLDRARGQQS